MTHVANTNYFLGGTHSPHLLTVPGATTAFVPASISNKHDAILYKMGIEDILVYVLGAVAQSGGDSNVLNAALSDAAVLPYVDAIFAQWVQSLEYFTSRGQQVYAITGQYVHRASDPEYNLFGVLPRGVEIISYYETKQITYCNEHNIEYLSETHIYDDVNEAKVNEFYQGSIAWLANQGIDPALIAGLKDSGHPVKKGYRYLNKQIYDFILPLLMA